MSGSGGPPPPTGPSLLRPASASASGLGGSKRILWDEVTIAEHDKERGTRTRIAEPKTPYRPAAAASSSSSSSSFSSSTPAFPPSSAGSVVSDDGEGDGGAAAADDGQGGVLAVDDPRVMDALARHHMRINAGRGGGCSASDADSDTRGASHGALSGGGGGYASDASSRSAGSRSGRSRGIGSPDMHAHFSPAAMADDVGDGPASALGLLALAAAASAAVAADSAMVDADVEAAGSDDTDDGGRSRRSAAERAGFAQRRKQHYQGEFGMSVRDLLARARAAQDEEDEDEDEDKSRPGAGAGGVGEGKTDGEFASRSSLAAKERRRGGGGER